MRYTLDLQQVMARLAIRAALDSTPRPSYRALAGLFRTSFRTIRDASLRTVPEWAVLIATAKTPVSTERGAITRAKPVPGRPAWQPGDRSKAKLVPGERGPDVPDYTGDVEDYQGEVQEIDPNTDLDGDPDVDLEQLAARPAKTGVESKHPIRNLESD